MIVGFEALERRVAAMDHYGDYLRRVDVEALLDHYGAQNVIFDGDERLHSCLLDRVEPHHARGDRNPSASANVDKKLYICRAYWGGDILQFVQKMEQADHFADVLPVLAPFLEGVTVDNARFRSEIEKLLAAERGEQHVPPVYSDRVLRGWANYHPYLETRGVSHAAASRLQLGYDPVAVRITFPHWITWEGRARLVGWQKRSLDDPRWPVTLPDPDTGQLPKYKNSQGFPKLTTLYNQHRVDARGRREVVVVESPMSVAKAETLWDGTDTDPLGAVVATFGATLPEEQVALLRKYERVRVWMDDDGAGIKASRRLCDLLYRHTVVEYVAPETGKDLGDYNSRTDAVRLLDRAEPAVLALARWDAQDRKEGRRARR